MSKAGCVHLSFVVCFKSVFVCFSFRVRSVFQIFIVICIFFTKVGCTAPPPHVFKFNWSYMFSSGLACIINTVYIVRERTILVILIFFSSLASQCFHISHNESGKKWTGSNSDSVTTSKAHHWYNCIYADIILIFKRSVSTVSLHITAHFLCWLYSLLYVSSSL